MVVVAVAARSNDKGEVWLETLVNNRVILSTEPYDVDGMMDALDDALDAASVAKATLEAAGVPCQEVRS